MGPHTLPTVGRFAVLRDPYGAVFSAFTPEGEPPGHDGEARMGEVAMAYVVPAPGRSLDGEAIITWARERLANYKVPRYVVAVAEPPMNDSGADIMMVKGCTSELNSEARIM